MDYYRLSFMRSESKNLEYDVFVSESKTGQSVRIGRAKKTTSRWECRNPNDALVGYADSLIHASEMLMPSSQG